MELKLFTSVVLLPILWSFAESLEPIKIVRPVEANKAKKNPANIEYVVDDKSAPEEANCTDTFLRCSKWKDSNICRDDRYKAYMKYGCAKTCRYCGCRDTYQEAPYCAQWKTRGFCKKHKGQMETYCAKTCGFCGEDQKPKPGTKTLPPTSLRSDAPIETLPSNTSGKAPTTVAHSKVNPEVPPDSVAIARESIVTGRPFSLRKEEESTEEVSSIMAAVQGSKRGLTFKTEAMPGVWSLGDENEVKLPDQYAPYGSEKEAPLNPMEEGKFMTPTKSDDKYEYFTGHYSNDPFVAESQREEWTNRNKKITGENYRKSMSKKPQDKGIRNENSPDEASAVKKATLGELTKERAYKNQIQLHSL